MNRRNRTVVVLVVVLALAAPTAFAATEDRVATDGSISWHHWLAGLWNWWDGILALEVMSGAGESGDGGSDGADPADGTPDPLEPGGNLGPWGDPDGVNSEGGEAAEV